MKQQAIETGKRDGVATEGREELKRLRHENKILKEEREVLRQATAFFSREESRDRKRQ